MVESAIKDYTKYLKTDTQAEVKISIFGFFNPIIHKD